MKPFSISKIYTDKISQERTIDINALPENYCSFDCVFCPLGRTIVKTDKDFDFKVDTDLLLTKLNNILEKNQNMIDTVFIDPDGDVLANSRLSEILNLIKKYHIKVKTISSGYLFNIPKYRDRMNLFDEIIGELVITNEENFQKIQRPMKGFTLDNYISNLKNFVKQYEGKFILEITILKNYSDSHENIIEFKEYIKQINPDEVVVQTPSKDKFKKAFGVEDKILYEIKKELDIINII